MTLVVPFPLFYLYVTISLFILLTFALYLPRYLGRYDSGYLNTYMSSSDDVPNNSILFYPIRKILLVSRYIIGTITSVSIQTEHSDLFLSNYKNSICFYAIITIILLNSTTANVYKTYLLKVFLNFNCNLGFKWSIDLLQFTASKRAPNTAMRLCRFIYSWLGT